nr:hypothetical protein [Bacteroidia bacterium]
ICNAGIGDTDHVVERYGSGFSIDVTNSASMQQAVDNYDELGKIPKTKIMQGATEFYSLVSGVNKYLNVYKNLIE